MTKEAIIGVHTAPDVDVAVATWILQEYGERKSKKLKPFFLKGGENHFPNTMGITFLDRGQGELDHHRRQTLEETTASLVAKKFGAAEDKDIQQLLEMTKRTDLQGETEIFGLADLIKCIQRDINIDDKSKLDLGVRLTDSAMEFKRKKLQRNNLYGKEIIGKFLAKKNAKFTPEKISQYLRNLENPRFERPFDFLEIIIGEKEKSGEEIAKELAEKLLDIVYQDSLNFYKAKIEVKNALRLKVKDVVIVAGYSENPKFNTAARIEGGMVIIQRKKSGHTQIFFDTKKVDGKLSDLIIAMLRFEECLVQGRQDFQKFGNVDFRKNGVIEEIPEWYYFSAPSLKDRKPGKFILNGSLTATDVPPSKIPSDTILDIVRCAVKYCDRFNWSWWQSNRTSKYIKKPEVKNFRPFFIPKR